MKVSTHLEKVERLDALRRRLDPFGDFELWFWITMIAGTNAVNAALHAAGVTDDSERFPTQPGVYLVPDKEKPGEWRPTLASLGDVLHVGRPRIEAPLPPMLVAMCAAMEVIEANRDPCVRAERRITEEIVDACDDAYSRCLTLMREVLTESGDTDR